MGVGGVRLVAQAIDDPQVEVAQHRERRIIQADDIGRVCHAAEAVAGRRRAEAVVLNEGDDGDSAYGKRAVNDLRPQQWPIEAAAATLGLREDVAEAL